MPAARSEPRRSTPAPTATSCARSTSPACSRPSTLCSRVARLNFLLADAHLGCERLIFFQLFLLEAPERLGALVDDHLVDLRRLLEERGIRGRLFHERGPLLHDGGRKLRRPRQPLPAHDVEIGEARLLRRRHFFKAG